MMVSLSLLVPGALTHRLQNLTACLIQNGLWGLEIGQILLNKFFDSIIPSMRSSKIQNGRQGAQKWPTGSGKVYTPWLLGAPVNFR